MKRFDVINHIIEVKGFRSYLEIGTQAFVCMNHVKCKKKVGVDPAPVVQVPEDIEFHKMTSDEYFVKNNRMFDIIFIDGLHHSDQVYKDLVNATDRLTDNGVIVVHDCNPQAEINQRVPMPHVESWNGDVWKAWLKFRRQFMARPSFVVDTDQGCGVIGLGPNVNKAVDIPENPSFETFNKPENKSKWLNLITINKFLEWADM